MNFTIQEKIAKEFLSELREYISNCEQIIDRQHTAWNRRECIRFWKKNKKGITNSQIAEKMGISISRVQQLSKKEASLIYLPAVPELPKRLIITKKEEGN